MAIVSIIDDMGCLQSGDMTRVFVQWVSVKQSLPVERQAVCFSLDHSGTLFLSGGDMGLKKS